MQIRTAELSDLDGLSRLFDAYRQFYGQEPDLDGAASFIGQRLSLNDSVILLAISDESPVGFTQLYPSFSSVSMQRIYILNDLYVSLEARRKGAATSLLDAAERFAVGQRASKLTLATEVTNGLAQSLYETQNWKKNQRFVHYSKSLESTSI